MMTTYNIILDRKNSKYIPPTGPLAHNPTSFLVDYLIQFISKLLK